MYMVVLVEDSSACIRCKSRRDELYKRPSDLGNSRIKPPSFLLGFWWHRVRVVKDSSRVVLGGVYHQQNSTTCYWITAEEYSL
jgi:hypothetical protein